MITAFEARERLAAADGENAYMALADELAGADDFEHQCIAVMALMKVGDSIARERLISRYGDSQDRRLRAIVDRTLQQIAIERIGTEEDPLEVLDTLESFFSLPSTPEDVQTAAEALVLKGAILLERGDTDRALAVFEGVLERSGAAATREPRRRVMRAVVELEGTEHVVEFAFDDDDPATWVTSFATALAPYLVGETPAEEVGLAEWLVDLGEDVYDPSEDATYDEIHVANSLYGLVATSFVGSDEEQVRLVAAKARIREVETLREMWYHPGRSGTGVAGTGDGDRAARRCHRSAPWFRLRGRARAPPTPGEGAQAAGDVALRHLRERSRVRHIHGARRACRGQHR